MPLTTHGRSARRFTLAIVFVVLGVAASVGAAAAKPSSACEPGALRLGQAALEARGSGWKVDFSVDLIGCKKNLAAITPVETRSLDKEFENPTQLTILLIVAAPRGEILRERATARVNELLGRKAITDVLISGVTLWDHGALVEEGASHGDQSLNAKW